MTVRGHAPQRTCLGCRQALERERLVRYVMSPEGEVLVDYGGKLPGRGAYTHPSPACIAAAVRSRQFERAFRGKCRLPEAEFLISELGRQVRGRVVNLLGMARKSGQVISGTNLVLSALAAPTRPALVLLTEDISPAIGAKVKERAERAGIEVFRHLDKGLVGQILGKSERSAVALPVGTLTGSIRDELIRYKHIAGES